MKDEHITGAAFTMLFLLLTACFLASGYYSAGRGITGDCEDFGKFEFEDIWYNCTTHHIED